MNAIDVRPTTTSVYGAVHLAYALVDSPRLAEWKQFGAEGIGMALADSEPDTLAFRTDAHARRLIVRKSPAEDLALGWQIDGPSALDAILGRLAARGVKVEEAGGDEAALRGSNASGGSSGRRARRSNCSSSPKSPPTRRRFLSAAL
jgi:hypothetical protein